MLCKEFGACKATDPLPLSFCARATAGQETPQTARVRLPRRDPRRLARIGSVSGELFTEQEGLFRRDKISQLGLSLKQWSVTEILPIEMQKVEGAEDQALRSPSNG